MKNWPRLSETLPHLEPGRCSRCGVKEVAHVLQIWQEHDEDDRPELRWVILCQPCAEVVIEPHVRLYDWVDRNTPAPGAMNLCTPCVHRRGLLCLRTKPAGGAGIIITASSPTVAHFDGRGKKGRWAKWLKLYPEAPSGCSGLETKTP